MQELKAYLYMRDLFEYDGWVLVDVKSTNIIQDLSVCVDLSKGLEIYNENGITQKYNP
jgi:hypothetical protein